MPKNIYGFSKNILKNLRIVYQIVYRCHEDLGDKIKKDRYLCMPKKFMNFTKNVLKYIKIVYQIVHRPNHKKTYSTIAYFRYVVSM